MNRLICSCSLGCSFPQEIDLKSLVYEAYHKGAQELLYVVPFVAKVLESTAKSKVSIERERESVMLLCCDYHAIISRLENLVLVV